MSSAPEFLSDNGGYTWTLPASAPDDFVPVSRHSGVDTRYPLEVAFAIAPGRPRADDVRRLWKARYANAPSPLLLVVGYEDDGRWKASICGPAGDEPPVEAGLALGQVERLAAAALAEPSRHAAVRFLSAMWAELETELPGLRNAGMLASHELREGVPQRPDWADACERGRLLLERRGTDLVRRLGYSIESHATAASVLSVKETKRAIAVFLDEGEDFETPADRFTSSSPVSFALALADREALPWVLVTRGRQIRVYAAGPDVGVGRKGRAETYVEANLALLPQDRAGYLPLLFSASALAEGGTFEEILDTSRDYAAELGARLRERVYNDAVPALAIALASRHEGGLDDALEEIYEQALTALFRLLFVAYAEDKDLLPYRSNGAYREHALKTLARDLADRRAAGALAFDPNATDLWDDVATLWVAVDKGNVERGVPAYNGGLFSAEETINRAGATLARIRLSNAEFGPALLAMLVDEADGGPGPVDFRSLSVREFGTIYEGLLESSLSVAQSDLALDSRNNYVPAANGDEPVVHEGEVYFHNRSGARKATGSYFTKPFAVEHLLDHALEPALDRHLRRVAALLEESEEGKAAEAFFDFRCVDLAMGSGHFLVAAVDRIEARLSAFLALHAIPQVTAEVERLRTAALDALGPLGEGVEIEQSTLLRRQIARRCIYGVDKNPIAVELARLGIWIHTFVPGLPLSFLDHSLVCGDSLTGVGSINEAVDALDPGDDTSMSLLRDSIVELLGRAQSALARLGRLSDATAREITDARAAQTEAEKETESARHLFNLIVGARLGVADLPAVFDDSSIASQPKLPAASESVDKLNALHFPIAFPEVFLRETPGFDCILGNPPWEKLQVERHSFYALHYPGLRGLTQAEAAAEIEKIEIARPDLRRAYEQDTEAIQQAALALARGPYPGFTAGRPDLYKAFAWRFLALLASGGRFGVVLPRKAVEASGMAQWRVAMLKAADVADLTLLGNNGGWVFDDAESRYTIALLTAQADAPDRRVIVRGPFRSRREYVDGMQRQPVLIAADDLMSWSPSAAIPLLPSAEMAAVFAKIRSHPRLGETSKAWIPKGLRELNATDDKAYFAFEPVSGAWPVYKGESFDLWTPDTGSYYAYAQPGVVTKRLIERQLNQIRNRRSAFFGLPRAWAVDEASLPASRPRIAWRDVARSTDSRTVRAALIPPKCVLVHQAYYLFWREGTDRDEAFVLGVISSLPFDWFARQMVESHVTVEFMDSAPVPRVASTDPLRRRVEKIAGRLAAVDERYESWAAAVGVPVGGVAPGAERDDLVAELDAAVARLYGLDERDIEVVFQTFHDGWDYRPRLSAVLAHFRTHR
jgi:hypothetical protein